MGLNILAGTRSKKTYWNRWITENDHKIHTIWALAWLAASILILIVWIELSTLSFSFLIERIWSLIFSSFCWHNSSIVMIWWNRWASSFRQISCLHTVQNRMSSHFLFCSHFVACFISPINVLVAIGIGIGCVSFVSLRLTASFRFPNVNLSWLKTCGPSSLVLGFITYDLANIHYH